MIKILRLTFIFLSIYLVSCKSSNKKTDDKEKPVVTVSILPLETFVKKIVGNDFEVNVLLPPGASPADFTLAPSQLKKIAKSEVWFRIGYIGFEFSWKEKIQQVNTQMKTVNLSEGLNLIRNETLPSGEINPLGGVNPHTWLSPLLVKQMAEQITQELTVLNPEKSNEYKENYKQFADEIDELHASIKNSLENYSGREFIMFHPSLSYFARDYGLTQYSLEPGGKQPSPQRMANVMELAKKENIRVIYIQSDLDREQARVFAEEVDGKIVEMWPLNPNWKNNLLEITGSLIKHF